MRYFVTIFVALLAAMGMAFSVTLFFGVESSSAKTRYSQVVDNSTKGHFKMYTKWDLNSWASGKRGKNYRVARPARKGSARYRFKTPTTGFYTVCGRWPAAGKYNSATPIRITTTNGIKVRRVNQRKNDGRLVRIGTYRLKAGNNYKVAVARNSKKSGWIIADAFKIIKADSSKGVQCKQAKKKAKKKKSGLTSKQKGNKIYRAGKKYVGTRYFLGNKNHCVPRKKMDCSCLTLTAYKQAVKMALPDHQARQYKYGRKVTKLRRGDLLFYDEDGRGGMNVTHVGIYAGNKKVLHASSYWGKVVIKPMRWPGDGYLGARRLV